MIDHISHSLIDSWLNCQTKYKYRYILGLEGEEVEALRDGKEYHEEVDKYHRGLEYNEELIQNYTRVFPKNYRLNSEYRILPKGDSEPIKLFYKMKVLDLPFHGVIDNIGDGFLSDLKYMNGKLSKRQADESRQPTFYLWWYWITHNEIVPFVYQCVDKKTGKVAVIKTERTEEDFEKLCDDVKEIIRDIRQAENEESYISNAGWQCNYCKYNLICPDRKE